MRKSTLVCGPSPRRLAIRGRTSNRRVMTCPAVSWLRVVLFVSRHGYKPVESDCWGIDPDRVEAFSEALERALLFTPQGDHATQVDVWRRMSAVPADTRLTHGQMALRECLLAMDRDHARLGWSSPKTRALLERLRRVTLAEGGLRIEPTP